MQNSNLQCFLRIICASSLAMNFPEMGRSSSTVHSKRALKLAVVLMSFFLMSQRELIAIHLLKIQ